MSENVWLGEQLKTCKNLIDIALLLHQLNQKALIPTVLELLFEQVSQLIDDVCVEKLVAPM